MVAQQPGRSSSTTAQVLISRHSYAIKCRPLAGISGLSATFPYPDYGRVARNPSGIGAERGDHFLQADPSVLIAPRRVSWRFGANVTGANHQ
jgi:hypothetical protein